MNKMQQAQPKFTTDADGKQLAHVALANTQQRATLYAEDYKQLMEQGWSPYWSLTNTGGRFEYVLSHAHGSTGTRRTITLARLIAQAAKKQQVKYADGDRTNLRRDNLLIVRGSGSAKAHASALRPRKDAAPLRTPTVTTETPQTPQTPAVPMQPRAAYTPRTIDTVAIGQRVREQMARRAEQITGQA
jgi:hypothetical protein